MRNWGERRSREGGVWMGRTREENERRKRGKEGILVRIDVEGSFAEKN